MVQYDNQKLVSHVSIQVQGSTPRSFCFSLVFINNLIGTEKSVRLSVISDLSEIQNIMQIRYEMRNMS